jgi:DNA-binding NarL/FixJ family response regulator
MSRPALARDRHAAPARGLREEVIRVILGDDHQAMRRGLRRVLDGERGIRVIAEGEDLATVMHEVRCRHPNVLVLDLSMLGGSSIDAIRRLREWAPATQIVVLRMEANAAFAQHAIDAGAIGFVLKDTADGELPEAIRRAAHGREYVSPRVAGRLRVRRDASGARGALSGRAQEASWRLSAAPGALAAEPAEAARSGSSAATSVPCSPERTVKVPPTR